MSQVSPLSQHVGRAERSLQAVLARELAVADLSFAEWTTLVFLHSGPLDRQALFDRQRVGHVAGAGEALAGLLERGLVEGETGAGARVALTDDGRALFEPLRARVAVLVAELHAGLPAADVEATRRILDELARRADALCG